MLLYIYVTIFKGLIFHRWQLGRQFCNFISCILPKKCILMKENLKVKISRQKSCCKIHKIYIPWNCYIYIYIQYIYVYTHMYWICMYIPLTVHVHAFVFHTRECTRGGFCNFMHLKPISRDLKWVKIYNKTSIIWHLSNPESIIILFQSLQSRHVKDHSRTIQLNFCQHISLYNKVKNISNVTFTISSLDWTFKGSFESSTFVNTLLTVHILLAVSYH